MWSQIEGHKKQIEWLKKGLEEKKIPHALLFSGLEGIGKKMSAIGFAQGLNCWQKKAVPCEQCPACLKIAKNIHPDISVIGPEGLVIKIEAARAMKQKAYLHPLEGRAKVFLIDQAESMTTAGANALLKILEEPPAETYFILISSAPSRILPTIRSRCQSIAFQPLAAKDIQTILLRQGVTKEEADRRARMAHGSVCQAMQFDFDLWRQAGENLEKLLSQPDPSMICEWAEVLCEEEEKLLPLLRAFQHWAHEKLMAARDPALARHWAKRWQAAQTADHLLETYANQRLLIENLLFTLTS